MLSNKELGEYLKKLRESKELSLRRVGELTGISYSHLAFVEHGKRNVTPALLRNLANLYNVNYIDLYEKAGYIDLINDEIKNSVKSFVEAMNSIENSVVKVPILGKISAGKPICAEENLQGYEFIPTSTINLNEEYFCLLVQGDSMNMKFKEGDRVLIHKQDELENGEIGVILVNGDDATIKKYRYDNGMVILEPMSTNPEHHIQVYNPKDTSIKIIGKAIRYISEL